jgi:hypothetical protein
MDERAFIQLEVRDFGGDSVCFQYILRLLVIRTFVGLYGSNTYVSVPFKFFSMRISSSQELLGFRLRRRSVSCICSSYYSTE